MPGRMLSKPVLGFALAASLAGPVFAGEYAVLRTGFRIHVDSHERAGELIRLHTREGVTEIPAAAVIAFEAEEFHTPPAAQANTGAFFNSQNTAPFDAKPSPATPADQKLLVQAAALRSGLPPALVSSVAAVESGFRPDAVSSKGAIGVMQLMPGTARRLSADPHDAAQNIDAGARLLRELLIKYDGDVIKALSAYNAGEAAVDRYNGVPPFAETQNYVRKVVRTYLDNGGK